MKSCILVLFTLMFNVSFSQGENDILRIRTMTEYVNTHLGDFKKASLKTAGPADAEKKEIEIYTSEPNTIRLITETYPSETGKTIIRDYLENGEPYFVLKEYYTYNVPITDTKFDIQKSEKKEVSYFFKNGRVIKWMTGKKTNKFDKASAIVENNIIENIRSIVSEYEKAGAP